MTQIALIVVGILGAVLVITGVAGVIRPDRILDRVVSFWRSPAGWPSAVGVRLVLGIALLVCASASALPGFFTVVGWLAIAGAVFVLFGRKWVDRILEWLPPRAAGLYRGMSILIALVGGALIYGVVPA